VGHGINLYGLGHAAWSPMRKPVFQAGLVDAAAGRRRFLMYRRNLVLGLIASSCFGIRRAIAWPLVTRQQLQRENAAPHEAAPAQTRAGAPTIRIHEPDITRPIRSPVLIRITFQAAANASIVVNSLRVRYGFLGIDITRRILAHARPTASGVTSMTLNFPEVTTG
jgi:hypothetical protein